VKGRPSRKEDSPRGADYARPWSGRASRGALSYLCTSTVSSAVTMVVAAATRTVSVLSDLIFVKRWRCKAEHLIQALQLQSSFGQGEPPLLACQRPWWWRSCFTDSSGQLGCWTQRGMESGSKADAGQLVRRASNVRRCLSHTAQCLSVLPQRLGPHDEKVEVP
jgi:hypothetical protein